MPVCIEHGPNAFSCEALPPNLWQKQLAKLDGLVWVIGSAHAANDLVFELEIGKQWRNASCHFPVFLGDLCRID